MNKPKAYSYIRFSSKRQEKGSSVERQLAATKRFAEEHQLDLQDLSFQDLGVSAYRGKHAVEGQLRMFVEAVECGTIEEGSWLLVESLDRISRERLQDASTRLTSLLSLGVTVATIADRQIYTPDSANNLGHAISILVSLSRSHEESQMKSQRAKGGWSKTRRVAAEQGKHPKSKGGILPGWLKKTEDGETVPIDERVTVVKSIYQWALEGLGSVAITNRLNTRGIPSFTKGGQWSAGSISKILTRRYVLGEWQPNRTSIAEDGRRKLIPDGTPIKIYPAIISEADWLRVQAMRKQRDTLSGRAAKGKLSNVFSGLARCACGAPIRFVRRKNKKDTVVCRTSEYGQRCDHRKHLQYGLLMPCCLSALAQLDFSALFPETRSKLDKQRRQKEDELTHIENQHETAQKRKQKALTKLLDADNPHLEAALEEAVSLHGAQADDALKAAERIRSELAELAKAVEKSVKTTSGFQHLPRLLAEDGGPEKVNRFLKEQLAAMIVDAQGGQITLELKHTGEQLLVEVNLKEQSWETYRAVTVDRKPELINAGCLRPKQAERQKISPMFTAPITDEEREQISRSLCKPQNRSDSGHCPDFPPLRNLKSRE